MSKIFESKFNVLILAVFVAQTILIFMKLVNYTEANWNVILLPIYVYGVVSIILFTIIQFAVSLHKDEEDA